MGPACTLCGSELINNISVGANTQAYFHCQACDLRFLNPDSRLSAEDEKTRYLSHNNDIEDPAYQKFVTPLLNELMSEIKRPAKGLDFGAGTGPVLASLLKQRGYEVALYDPFFWPDRSVLEVSYDFAFACEVIEHFHHPFKEFQTLYDILRPGGTLAVMTHIYDAKMDFPNWYYRRDPTHVSFYSAPTFEWIKKKFPFSRVRLASDRIALLTK